MNYKEEFVVELHWMTATAAIAVLAEDILFLASLFYYSVVFSSLLWFGTPSVLLSFLCLFGNLKLVVLGYGTS